MTNTSMKVAVVLIIFVVSFTSIECFSAKIFTPKVGWKSKQDPPMASVKAKILSKCWVSRDVYN